jgi:thiol-disulfide isomerase/thioredoxin
MMMTPREIQSNALRAHELYGDFWFNSEPLPVSALRGQVILLEIWDYTCISSHRVMPYVKEWDCKYRDHGLVVIGVHAPKFPFARDPAEVQKAIRRLGIGFPVVMDNQHLIATQYGNRVWPSIYLIDKNGFVRFQSEGEGSYDVIERAIQSLIHDARVGETLPTLMGPVRDEDKPGVACYRSTPEIYSGYVRGSIGNVEGYSPESAVDYVDPQVYLPGRFYADGPWLNQRDCLSFIGQTGRQGHLILKYHALEVNAVLRSERKVSCGLVISQDGRSLDEETKGLDILLDPGGCSLVSVLEGRLYNLVRNREYGEHTLRMAVGADGLALYSFSFVTSIIPELISNN